MGLDMYLEARDKGGNVWEAAYWRKANQVHNWFVENVQEGVDDCGAYEVTIDELQHLIDLCSKAKDIMDASSRDESADGEYDGEVVEKLNELLPTTSGFFFGTTEYDEWYYSQIEDTINQLEKVKENHEDGVTYKYCSSW